MKTAPAPPPALYASCPQLDDPDPEDSDALQLGTKYDSYHTLVVRRRKNSLDGSETATDVSSSSASSGDAETQLADQERLQVETFFRSLKTQVFVCSSLANLYLGCTSATEPNWQLKHTGVPVLLLDSGEARSRDKRQIQILLAERGTCFTLWRDTIDNLTSYREAGQAFHTMHLSRDHTSLAGLSFDCPRAAAEMWAHVERLTASPENISLSVPGRRGRKAQARRPPKPQPLPAKTHISQPCCFQHVTSVDAGDRSRYFSLQTLLPGRPPAPDQGTEL